MKRRDFIGRAGATMMPLPVFASILVTNGRGDGQHEANSGPVHFANAGTYLVICTVRSHFVDHQMWAWVKVLP